MKFEKLGRRKNPHPNPPPQATEGVTVFKDEVGKGQEKGQDKYEMGRSRSCV